jgi:succinoglycan biosynthesis transport protein ExoP
MAQVDVNLRDVFRVLRKRKWIIIFAPILMGLSTYFMTEIPPAVYTSQALIKLSRSSTVSGLMAERLTFSAYDNMATQIMVISSAPVLEDVAKRLNMVKQGENPQDAVDELRGRTSAEQQNGSDILAVRGTAGTEPEAMALANTLVDTYIQHYKADRDKQINETVNYIRRRSEEATEQLGVAQRALFDFRRNQGSNLTHDPSLAVQLQEKNSSYQQKINDLEATLTTITSIRQSKEYDGLVETYFIVDDGVARAMADEAVKRAAAWVEARNKKNALSFYQTDVHPSVIAANAQLSQAEQRVANQLDTLATRLKVIIAENKRLQAEVEKQAAALTRQPELASQLDDLTLDVQQKQELANSLHKQLQDSEIQQREQIDEVTVVERAHNAATIPQPGRTYRALIGAMIGILIGGVFAFIRESMDTSLGTIEDVEQHINSVVLGIIPHLEKDDTRDRMKFDRGPGPTAEELDRFARLVTHFDPKSIGSEAYRTLRTNVASIMSRTGGKVLLVSSSMIQEGKTTSVTNLATAFAQSGKKTLLIDADLRRPSVDKTYGIVRVPGLTDLLLDTRDPRECYRTIDDIILGKYGLKLAQSTTGLEYLTILPAGRIVDKPTELLNTPAIDALLEDVRSRFDVVLIDVSPILPVADAFVLAPKVDGVLLAYQLGRVARDVLKRTKQRVESVGGKVWGVILNDIQSEIDYRSGDFSYYHYRYDRHLDEPKTVMNRIKSMLRLRSSKPRKPAIERRPPPPPPPIRPGGGPESSGSSEVRDVMSITDDN